MTDSGCRITVNYKRTNNVQRKGIRRKRMAKRIVNIRLRPDQEERINAIVERSAILDTSKFVRIAVDWLLKSYIGQVNNELIVDQAFPDYTIPKKPTRRKQRSRNNP